MPLAAGATVAVTAAVVLGGIPGSPGGPSSAAAITQTLRWLDPPSGSVLHVRSVETRGGRTTTREYWQSASDPSTERERVEGASTFETAGGALYDPSTNTIYQAATEPAGSSRATTDKPPLADTKAATGGAPRPAIGRVEPDVLPAADPVVTKVRTLLRLGRMTVAGRELHDGTDSWAISLRPDAGRPVWTLWVAVADGKPLELRDPGRDAGDPPQVTRWPTYEVLDGANERLVTLAGAHPSPHVVHDPAQVTAAEQRLLTPVR